MLAAEQRLRKARSSSSNERSVRGEPETASLSYAQNTSQSMTTRLRKRDQYSGSGHASGFENGSSAKSAEPTVDIKDGSSETSESPPARAPGLSPLTTATLTPPLGQFIVNLLLQLAGIVAAVAFGIFAVESLNVAKQANMEARVANQVAMFAICTQVRPWASTHTARAGGQANLATEQQSPSFLFPSTCQ